MKALFSYVILQTILISNCLSGLILETAHFKEILQHAQPNTLVLLDIDDTILVPKQTLGSDVWFTYRFKHHLQNYEREQAFDKALAEWEAVRHLSEMEIVENGTVEVIRELQNKNITVMCLTTQGLALATRTVNQLLSLGVDPLLTAPSKDDHYFINSHGVLYRHGVLFTSGTPKGTALTKLLEIIDFKPKHVVFINDKLTHLKDLESGLLTENIPFTGLRYSYSDERVKNFDPRIADIQWNCSSFGKILSDEEAKDLTGCQAGNS